jgi:hypothetical protein
MDIKRIDNTGYNDLFKVIANNEIGNDNAEPTFYYESDHLGSASYVTNDNGQVT